MNTKALKEQLNTDEVWLDIDGYDEDSFDKFACSFTNKIEVYQYDKAWNFIKKFDSITQASNETKCDKACIIKCCKGKQETSLGYRWSYYDRYADS